MGLMAVSHIVALIEPFWYVQRVYKRLKERLLLDDETIREVERETKKSAQLNPPVLHILPGRDNDLTVQLDLVSLSY